MHSKNDAGTRRQLAIPGIKWACLYPAVGQANTISVFCFICEGLCKADTAERYSADNPWKHKSFDTHNNFMLTKRKQLLNMVMLNMLNILDDKKQDELFMGLFTWSTLTKGLYVHCIMTTLWLTAHSFTKRTVTLAWWAAVPGCTSHNPITAAILGYFSGTAPPHFAGTFTSTLFSTMASTSPLGRQQGNHFPGVLKPFSSLQRGNISQLMSFSLHDC